MGRDVSPEPCSFELYGSASRVLGSVPADPAQSYKKIQELYLLFQTQLIDGCHEASCRTPTCATFRARISTKPFRRYTVLSARILAVELASGTCPSARLCPHLVEHYRQTAKKRRESSAKILQSPEFSNLPGADSPRKSPRRAGDSKGIAKAGGEIRTKMPDSMIAGNEFNGERRANEKRSDQAHGHSGLSSLEAATTKDTKSLTQSIFSTEVMAAFAQSDIPRRNPSSRRPAEVGSDTLSGGRNKHFNSAAGCVHRDSIELTRSSTVEGRESLLHHMRPFGSPEELLGLSVDDIVQEENSVSDVSADFVFIVQHFLAQYQHQTDPRVVLFALSRCAYALCHLNGPYPCSKLSSCNNTPGHQSRSEMCLPNNMQTLQLFRISLAALVASILGALDSCSIPSAAWEECTETRSHGSWSHKGHKAEQRSSNKSQGHCLPLMDALTEEASHLLVQRLSSSLANLMYSPGGIHHGLIEEGNLDRRRFAIDIAKTLSTSSQGPSASVEMHGDALEPQAARPGTWTAKKAEGWVSKSQIELEIVIELFRGVLLTDWDGEATVPRCSAVTGALEILAALYATYVGSDLVAKEKFYTAYISERLDVVTVPKAFMKFDARTDKAHLLHYPFLFAPSVFISYFRAINHAAMQGASDEGYANQQLLGRLDYSRRDSSQRGKLRLKHIYSSFTDHYFVLNIRRDYVLLDAMDQLWRRQRSELLRPLKVILGTDLGEVGSDYGGVQQEFMRLAIAEAFNPQYGMFTTDEQTQMSWFQVNSLEPLYKFELVGILTSLAIYNGLTLPCTFPTALYSKLLGQEVKQLDDIQDGWPDLVKGLQQLRGWSEGDVEHVFMRDYVFSTEVYGQTVDTPISDKTGTTRSKMVNDENRFDYIQGYIDHLVNVSIETQYHAFAQGVMTCISPKALELFTPAALKELVEGSSSIDTHEVERAVTYEAGYHKDHRMIRDFWHVVHGWDKKPPPESGKSKARQLLEFVTASDRLPVGGMDRFGFVIQQNGTSDMQWPTSLTCFGRLLLPEYSSIEILRVMLDRALENSQGFGQI